MHLWKESKPEWGDYLIVDELGRTCWASDWCRRVYVETFPRGVGRAGFARWIKARG